MIWAYPCNVHIVSTPLCQCRKNCGYATRVVWFPLHLIAARVLYFYWGKGITIFIGARVLWFTLGQCYYDFHGDKGIMVFIRGKGSIGEVFYQGVLIGILGQVWCLIVSISDHCPLSYFVGIPLVKVYL